jgi:DNA-binding Lrp family transcriptional regulator
MQMDKIDAKIIQELMKDTQAPFTSIGKALHISHETVRKRFEKMKKEGIIERCSIVIDRSKLGYQGTAFLLISNTKNKDTKSTIEALKKIPNIIMYGNTMGAFDIFASATIKDLIDLEKLVDKVQKIPTVDRLDVAILSFTYFTFAPIPRTPIKCDKTELT